MKIYMAGLDHKIAPIEVREKFAVSKEKMKDILRVYTELPCIGGAVIINTCNRTEIYTSVQEGERINAAEIFCRGIGLDYEDNSGYFSDRDESGTIRHLCLVAAGLKSQILGDDQIITQVREAIEFSRECRNTDSFIERFFNIAIQTGKEIKTRLAVKDFRNSTAPHKAVEKLKDNMALNDKNTVIIGNGQMGRLAAELLLREEAKVTVTLREYKKGIVQIPEGASSVSYSNRYEAIEEADIVISATTSPHYTVHFEDYIKLSRFPRTLIDLAVPRDIEPAIGDLPEVTLFTIDDLAGSTAQLNQEKKDQVEGIIAKNTENYYKWLTFKKTHKVAASNKVREATN